MIDSVSECHDLDLFYLKKEKPIVNGQTHRKYPQRDKFSKNNTYQIRVFKDQADFDRFYIVHFNKGSESKKIGYFVYDNYSQNILFKNVNFIKNFARDVYENKINGFDLKHLPKDLENNWNNTGNDMTYQELSNFLNCKIVVNENLKVNFDVAIGHSDDRKYRRSGFGRVDYKTYSQYGYSNHVQKENPKNLSYYDPNPTIDNIDNNNNKYIVMIMPPIKQHNYQYSTQMKIVRSRDSICKCCWYSNGRIWMLKGSGYKSLNKNKGMKKNKGKNQKNLINDDFLY